MFSAGNLMTQFIGTNDIAENVLNISYDLVGTLFNFIIKKIFQSYRFHVQRHEPRGVKEVLCCAEGTNGSQ